MWWWRSTPLNNQQGENIPPKVTRDQGDGWDFGAAHPNSRQKGSTVVEKHSQFVVFFCTRHWIKPAKIVVLVWYSINFILQNIQLYRDRGLGFQQTLANITTANSVLLLPILPFLVRVVNSATWGNSIQQFRDLLLLHACSVPISPMLSPDVTRCHQMSPDLAVASSRPGFAQSHKQEMEKLLMKVRTAKFWIQVVGPSRGGKIVGENQNMTWKL